MSAFKGTPGPWGIKRRHTKYEIFTDDELVAWVQPTLLPEDEFNVRLIAAAPELLSCLEMTAHGLEVASRVVGGNLGAVFSDRAMSARAAIAKATGGDA